MLDAHKHLDEEVATITPFKTSSCWSPGCLAKRYEDNETVYLVYCTSMFFCEECRSCVCNMHTKKQCHACRGPLTLLN